MSNYATFLRHDGDPVREWRPHLGHALEVVQADVLARHRRQRFKASRNYYTHHTPGDAYKAATRLDLYVLILQVSTLVEMSLLLEVGFDDARIDTMRERARRCEAIAGAQRQAPVRAEG